MKHKVKINEKIGTVEYLDQCIKNVELVLHENKIKVMVDIQIIKNSTRIDTLYPVTYSGSLNLNSGCDYNVNFPVQLTQKAKNRWKEYIEEWKIILLNHIENY